MTRRHPLCALVLLVGAVSADAAEPFRPDPLVVRRYDAGYRYPQHGWTVLHIEGQPYDRGLQHGRLMAKEIETYIAALSEHRAAKEPAEYWALYRQLVGGLYLSRFDREHLEEMKGIADGAAAAGARVHGRPIDLTDVAGVNLWVELACLDDALRATPSAVADLTLAKPAPAPAPLPPEHHCSAFAATGPATADGKIVFGHITMWNLHQAAHFNVWLDVKPAKGHRVVMQTFPGGIYSGMDYYLNSAGLMLTETTLDQTRFEPDGTPLASRARRAMQYGNTIDDVVKDLTVKNNGLYTNEWLIGDANTNEIAVLEQGSHTYRLRRSSKNEWLVPGVEGFYWGCNNAKDLRTRLETVASTSGRPEDVSWRPSDRDLAWLTLYRAHRGKIDVGFGKRAYSAAPLAKLHSLDAKVTTAALAKELKAHAVFGPPYGRVWEPAPGQREQYAIIRPLVPNDWTVLTTAAPGRADRVAADLSGKKFPSPPAAPPTNPAWHGTLLPAADADVWLTAGFARYERVVALENALKEKSGGKPSAAGRREVELALFKYRTDYNAAKAARPKWRAGGSPPTPLDAELDRARWHRERTAYGVLTLHALRTSVGSEAFAGAMDAFGRANAGKEVTAGTFARFVGEQTGKDVAGWLADRGEDPAVGGAAFSTANWLGETGSAVIVYGTAGDAAANRAAAAALAKAARVGHGNVVVPVKSDAEAADAELTGRHVVLVGRPATNRVAARFAAAFPVAFGTGSIAVGGDVFAHEGTAVVAAGANPLSPRYSAVLVAGLSADATYRVCERGSFPGAEVCVYPAGGGPRRLVVTPPARSTAGDGPKR
ncbi:MAG TPA: C45 family autoproteolytic acyltransferase/hydrolase [Fimbriiglobus sp.]|nr:C45 family autoproteolytic acyltransferase/hydrolase [Fimbriiglobus sp.]